MGTSTETETNRPEVIVIDADSILYTAMYSSIDSMESFYNKIWKILADVNKKHVVRKVELAFSGNNCFRFDIYDKYKFDRIPNIEIEKFRRRIHKENPFAVIIEEIEADDYCVYRSKQGYLVSAVDKDVIFQAENPVFDYNKGIWYRGMLPSEAERARVFQSLMGDSTDGIKGAKGIGRIKAEKLVRDKLDYYDWVDLFESEDDAIMNYRLVAMNQFDGKTVNLWNPDDWVLDKI